MRYSSMAMQMGATIFLGVWGGMKLDERFPRPFPLFTVILSLSSVILAVYMVLRDFIRKKPQ